MSKPLISAALLIVLGASVPLQVRAQAAPAPAASAAPAPAAAAASPASKLVLVPYERAGSTDPHAVAITKSLADDLAAAGMTVATTAPVDHLDAVANAAKVCSDNGVSGFLIPEGRYEQTKKIIPAPFVTILRYPTHVELRLDEFGCDGRIRWSTTTVGDEAPSGAFSVGNLGGAVDAAFRTAAKAAADARAASTVPQTVPAAVAAPETPAAPAAAPANYVLLPFEQPALADPRAADMTHSLLDRLQQHKIDVKAATPMNHLAAIASAPQLCAQNGVQGIIVPDVRIEQSAFSGRSHAELRLTSVSCTGGILGKGNGDADMGQAFMINYGAAVVGVAERAMNPAIEQLFPNAPKAG
ncbi:MAG TPA: hypothetical protein VHT53_05915 [Candidatus Elarobacter sp.]|nr:hypothetical protein [Candidatus Elarobacter sp.]